MRKWWKRRTTTATRADLAVARVLVVSTDISNARIVESLAGEGFAVHVLDSPEAACGDSRFRSALGDVDACGAGWAERHALGKREWAEQSRDKRWHGCGEHDDEEGGEKGFKRRRCGGSGTRYKGGG